MTAQLHYKPGLLRRTNVTDWLSFLAATIVSLVALLLMRLTLRQPMIGLVPFAAIVCLALLWRFPTLAVFTLFFVSTMIEVFPVGFVSTIPNLLPVWRNLTSMGIAPIPVSPVELLMLTGLAIQFIQGRLRRQDRAPASPVLRLYGVYILIVLIGGVHGMLQGATSNTALQEIRTQVYGAGALCVTIRLMRSRDDFERLGWLIIIGTGLKGLEGTWLYLTSVHGYYNELLAHEEALFFPAYYIFLLLMFIFGGARRQKRVGLLLLPCVIVADVSNNRRSSTALLVVALVILVIIIYTVLVERRKRILRVVSCVIVFLTLYAGAFWNSHTGIAQPVQAIKSQFAPDSRDALSNLYRVQEDKNLLAAIQSHLIAGQGYGLPLINVSGIIDLTDIAPLIRFMPHNSVLWVWWRVGLIGFVLFWMTVGWTIVRNCFVIRATSDPYIRRWATFAVCVAGILPLFGWLDMGLHWYRTAIYCWTVLGVAEVLGRSVVAASRSDTTGATIGDNDPAQPWRRVPEAGRISLPEMDLKLKRNT